MPSLLDLVQRAIADGDTAEGIATRARVAGDTVRRVVKRLPIRKESEEKLLAVLAPNDGTQGGTVSPLVARQMAWAEETLLAFSREYTARIAEALGASMAAAIRNPGFPTPGQHAAAADALRSAQLHRDAEQQENSQQKKQKRG